MPNVSVFTRNFMELKFLFHTDVNWAKNTTFLYVKTKICGFIVFMWKHIFEKNFTCFIIEKKYEMTVAAALANALLGLLHANKSSPFLIIRIICYGRCIMILEKLSWGMTQTRLRTTVLQDVSPKSKHVKQFLKTNFINGKVNFTKILLCSTCGIPIKHNYSILYPLIWMMAFILSLKCLHAYWPWQQILPQ